jgi:uncharacterized protein YodC (DUF2158 family)
MTQNKYKEGDLVQLKSGGPIMTVTDVASSGQHVHTKWFSGKKLEAGHFPMSALELPKEEK